MSCVPLAGNFLNKNKTNFRNLMFGTIKMKCKLAGFLVWEHRRLVIAKAYFECRGSRTYVLKIAFITRGQVNNIFGRAKQVLVNLIGSACGKAFKLRILNEKILTKITSR